MKSLLAIFISLLFFNACASQKPFPISDKQTKAGTYVFAKSDKMKLYKGSLKNGDNLAKTINRTLKSKIDPEVTIINIVPSVDTPVCEVQTHILGENEKINKNVKRITISRDLPMAQSRFAKEAKLTNIKYLSDFKGGKFGKKTGLLIKDAELLARAVVVLDKKGIVRYHQIVSDITTLPNMEKAIDFANQLTIE